MLPPSSPSTLGNGEPGLYLWNGFKAKGSAAADVTETGQPTQPLEKAQRGERPSLFSQVPVVAAPQINRCSHEIVQKKTSLGVLTVLAFVPKKVCSKEGSQEKLGRGSPTLLWIGFGSLMPLTSARPSPFTMWRNSYGCVWLLRVA